MEWYVSLSLKFILILLLPFYLLVGQESSYVCALFQIGPVPFLFGSQEIYNLPLVALFVVLLTSPGIAFDYIQHRRPRDQSVGGIFLIAFLLTNPFVQVFLLMPLLLAAGSAFMYNSVFYSALNYSMVIGMLVSFWASIVMVTIPYLLRETNSPISQNKNADYSVLRTVRGIISGIFRGNNLIAFGLGCSIFLLPTMVTNTTFLTSYGFSSRYWILVSGACLLQVGPAGLVFSSMSFILYVSIIISTVLYLVFVKVILSYLNGEATRTRCLVMGTLATLAAPFVRYIPMIVPIDTASSVYPLPFVLIAGLTVIWHVKPSRLKETPWGQSVVPSVEENPTPARIPLLHVIRSRFSGAKKQKEQYDWNHEADDLFRQHPESPDDD